MSFPTFTAHEMRRALALGGVDGPRLDADLISVDAPDDPDDETSPWFTEPHLLLLERVSGSCAARVRACFESKRGRLSTLV